MWLEPLAEITPPPASMARRYDTKVHVDIVVPCGLEPWTIWLLAVRSNQLSYET